MASLGGRGRKLFDAAFKTIEEAIVATARVNGTLDAPRPIKEAQEQLDEALRRFAGKKGLLWGDDGRPARTFNYRM